MSRVTLLVAEDDDDLRAYLVRALSGDGYRVLEARNGVELVSHIVDAHAKPAVVICDERMPKRTGTSAVRELRQRGFDAPVVLLTAFADEATLNAAATLSPSVVLSKPIGLDDLRIIVTCLLPDDVGRPRRSRRRLMRSRAVDGET